MLANGSFEDGPEAWRGWTEDRRRTTLAISSSVAKHGSIVATLRPEAGYDGRDYMISEISQALPKPFPPPNLESVRVGAWVRTTFHDAAFQRDSLKLVVGLATCKQIWAHEVRGDWQNHTCTVSASDDIRFGNLDVRALDYGGQHTVTNWRVDAVSLEVCLR
jgi:hypothetical protein